MNQTKKPTLLNHQILKRQRKLQPAITQKRDKRAINVHIYWKEDCIGYIFRGIISLGIKDGGRYLMWSMMMFIQRAVERGQSQAPRAQMSH